jgi:hypothetical protein
MMLCVFSVAPHYVDGLVTSQTYFVNPCHPQCEVCYGFSNAQCSRCSLGYFLYEGNTCVDSMNCGNGQEANTPLRLCKDKARVLMSTTLSNIQPNTSSIGLTRLEYANGYPQVINITMMENSTSPTAVFMSLSRAVQQDTRIDLQWDDTRDNLVRIVDGIMPRQSLSNWMVLLTLLDCCVKPCAGVATNTAKRISAWPLIAFFTSTDWMVPVPFNIKPVDDSAYQGDRTVNLTFTMDSTSFPVDDLMARSYAIRSVIYITILENDPLTLPVGGLTYDLRLYVIQGSAAVLTYTLPSQPKSAVQLVLTLTPIGTLFFGETKLGTFGAVVPSISLVSTITFTPEDWNTSHPVVVAPENASVFSDYSITLYRIDYRFTGSDIFYANARLTPNYVVTSSDRAGCPDQYTCANRVRDPEFPGMGCNCPHPFEPVRVCSSGRLCSPCGLCAELFGHDQQSVWRGQLLQMPAVLWRARLHRSCV